MSNLIKDIEEGNKLLKSYSNFIKSIVDFKEQTTDKDFCNKIIETFKIGINKNI